VHGVGGGEGVVHLIPVAVVVLRVESGDPRRGGVGDRAGEFLGGGAGRDGLVDRGHHVGGIVGQDRPGQLGDAVVVVEAFGRGGESLGEGGRGGGDHAGEVIRVPPGTPLLATARRGGL
jgi:hypothetical protein